jgi:hypothetical protein
LAREEIDHVIISPPRNFQGKKFSRQFQNVNVCVPKSHKPIFIFVSREKEHVFVEKKMPERATSKKHKIMHRYSLNNIM